ncbi:hypothetical protein APUTEX25_003785, partial [Auxenochlorella protothecoides]
EVEASPSRADGVDAATEDQLRRFGCGMLQRAVVLLGLPQGVAVTAQVLLHRFYCRRSLKKFDVKVTSIAAFWLAAKLEEVVEIDRPDRLRLRDVLTTFHRLLARAAGSPVPAPLDPHSARYAELKAAVVRDERHLLRALGFVIGAEQPHRFVLNYGALVLGAGTRVQQEAWNLANDSLHTTLCLTLRPEVVACGILFLAARRLGIPLPEAPPWWQPLGATTQQVHAVAAALCQLYAKPPAQYTDVRARGSGGPARGAAAGGADAEEGLETDAGVGKGAGVEAAAAAIDAVTLEQGPGSASRDARTDTARRRQAEGSDRAQPDGEHARERRESRERRRSRSREARERRHRDDSKRRRHHGE